MSQNEHLSCSLHRAQQRSHQNNRVKTHAYKQLYFYSTLILSSAGCDCKSVTYSVANDGNPSLLARPVSCIYCSTSVDGAQWIICRTLGQSSPIPNATVASTTLRIPQELQKVDKIVSFTEGVVQAVNISTSLNRAKSRAPMGSVISVCSLDLR